MWLQASRPLFTALGFPLEKDSDLGSVRNSFYRTLNIPDPGYAKQVTLIRASDEPSFCIDLIEWETPQTTRPAEAADPRRPGMAGVGVSVADIATTRDAFVAAGGRCAARCSSRGTS